MNQQSDSTSASRSLRFEAGNVTIHYLDWGEGSPRHLVLLHGLGSQAHAWDSFAQEVSTHFRVVAPDQRGHGESSHPEDGYTLERFASDVRALARHLNLPPFDLVGHSLGALVAIHLAAQHPSLVHRLVLVDGGPGLNLPVAREGSIELFKRPLGFNTQEEAAGWLGERYPDRPKEWIDERVKHGMKQNWAGKWVLRHDPELYWVLEGGALPPPQGEQQLWDALLRITCPTLVVRGAESPLLSAGTARRIAGAIPQGTMVEIPGAGHSIPADAPEAFQDAVVRFLLQA